MDIGLDFDGVIADCNVVKSIAAEKIYGEHISPRAFAMKEIAEVLTDDQYRNLKRRIYNTREFESAMRLICGAERTINALLAEGHVVRVITSRFDTSLTIARQFLLRHALPLQITGVGINTSKKEAADGLDVFIDDDVEKLEPLVTTVKHLYVFSYRDCDADEQNLRIRRVSSWEDIHNRIRALTKDT